MNKVGDTWGRDVGTVHEMRIQVTKVDEGNIVEYGVFTDMSGTLPVPVLGQSRVRGYGVAWLNRQGYQKLPN